MGKRSAFIDAKVLEYVTNGSRGITRCGISDCFWAQRMWGIGETEMTFDEWVEGKGATEAMKTYGFEELMRECWNAAAEDMGYVNGKTEWVKADELESRLQSQWLPIESAPKDGERIDIWVEWESRKGKQGKRIPNCYWHRKARAWKTNCYDKQGWCHWRDETATHWMPLPPPPQEKE